MEVPFIDGVRDVPDHLGELFKAHDIPTFRLTYEQAVDQINLLNTRTQINAAHDRLIADHLKAFGE